MKEKDKTINSFFEDKDQQLALINKFQPGFLKFVDEGKFEINRTVKLNISKDKITFSKFGTIDNETSKVENSYDGSFLSKGSIQSNITISKSIKNIIKI